jgi:tetratricopeptide (TPR) repeat protein
LEGDDEDRPPIFDLCFGRDEELRHLTQSQARVMFITGIGGQGKSTLAASYFTRSQKEHRFSFFVWRDCKEESERFENQIASVIENLSGGVLAGADLAKRPIEVLIDILLSRLKEMSALFVFDNVDHLVNLKNGRLTAAADLFVRKFLEVSTKCQIIFTCRPEIWQEENGSLRLHLEGLSLDACTELFAARNSHCAAEEIASAHELTNGHAFWLDLLALQVVRNQGLQLSTLVAEIRAGQGQLPDLTLQSIWSKLKDRETLVLQAMAETLRPETESEIASYLSRNLKYNKVNSAIKALRQLNLVVVKRSDQGEDLHELHPLVRQFVRSRFTVRQRTSMIEVIISVYNQFRGIHRSELKQRTSFTFLQNWTQAAELAIAAGKYSEACECLAEANSAFEASAFAREYGRVIRLLLTSCNWVHDHSELTKFDLVFCSHAHNLAYLGLQNEVDDLLDKFSQTVPEANSRYILYCEMKSHTAWTRENFQEAIKWGEIGHDLYLKSNVDTDHNIAHTLALALRDAGGPEKALPTFLEGRPLAEIIDPDELDEKGAGAHYGNVGRCLHFMGRVRDALVCYQKSALLIEKNIGHEHVMNQGYIRLWIGELLLSHNQKRLGIIFLDAARRKWDDVAPPRARRLEEMLHQICSPDISAEHGRELKDSEAICLEWIRGRNLDELFE